MKYYFDEQKKGPRDLQIEIDEQKKRKKGPHHQLQIKLITVVGSSNSGALYNCYSGSYPLILTYCTLS